MFHKPVSIALHRAEGKTDDATATTFAEATKKLREWSWTAPKEGGGYHKCDFKITFSDGSVYEGRFDLNDGPVAFLADHCQKYLNFASGRVKPHKYTDEQWAVILNRNPKHKEECNNWLDNYHFNDHGKVKISLSLQGKDCGHVMEQPGAGWTSGVTGRPAVFDTVEEAQDLAKNFTYFDVKIVPANELWLNEM